MEDLLNIEHTIQNISLSYSKLSDNCVADFMKVSKLLTADKFTLLVTEGQYADKSYFIVKGCARAYYLKYGKNIIDWFAFENDFKIQSIAFLKTFEVRILSNYLNRQPIWKYLDKIFLNYRTNTMILTGLAG